MNIRSHILIVGVLLGSGIAWQFSSIQSSIVASRTAAHEELLADAIQQNATELLIISQGLSTGSCERIREQWAISYDLLLNLILKSHDEPSGRTRNIAERIRDDLAEFQWLMRRLQVTETNNTAHSSDLSTALRGQIGGSAHDIVFASGQMKRIWRTAASAAQNRVLEVVVATSLVSICALLAGMVWVLRVLLRPIQALNDGTVALQSDLRYKLPNLGKNELGQLALAFNNMSTVLSSRTVALQEASLSATSRAHELESQKFALDEHSIVASTDPSGKITYVNDKFCHISQYSRSELIGKDHRIVNSGQHPRSFWAEAWKTITAGNAWRSEICNRAKDGSLYWVDTTIVPFKDEAGSVIQFVSLRQDITDRKRAETALRKSLADAESADLANQAKSDFLANMSHEIRTPMTAILGFAENMLEPDQSDSEKLNCVHTIRRNGEYLIGLINDILDLSKVEAGKMRVEQRDCQPCQIVAEVASLMCVRADAKGLPFNIEYIGTIPETIQSDPTRLRQILINMVGNSIKFTEVGAVRLVTRFVEYGDAPYLQFDVVDTGRGMTGEQVAKLFQPFMQADNSTTREFGGTGLGLTISKRFAELLGGDITIPSTELGVGTTFRATIATGSLDGVTMLDEPLSATTVAELANAVAQSAQSDLLGIRILFAEDGPDNQRLISFVLKKAGADVTVKDNGKLALDAALAARDEGKPFDVILMDMQMPVMDGYEATGQLRQKGYSAPIIALTAHAMANDREKCIKAGCDDYATKPVDRNRLIGLIKEYVEKSRSMPESLQAGTPEQPLLQGCRILLAEDNSTNQVLIGGILKKAGAKITTVKDGKLALDAAMSAYDSDNPFDIILSDIQMPLMGGDEATNLLRKQGYTKPIIALTAHATIGDREKYLEMGFDDYATKPINRLQLIETIRLHWVGSEAILTSFTKSHRSS